LFSIDHRSLSSLHAAQRGALAVEIGFDLHARTRQPLHHRPDLEAFVFF
jgi:hypothetical protein